MGLSILERPIGVGLGSSQSATIEEDYAGIATVKTSTPHHLAEDQYVYVKSYVEDYNGFWKIHFVDGYHFFLKKSTGIYVTYIVDTTATIYPQSFIHGWSCVELPIVYKLSSDRFPVNNLDTPTTINAYVEQDGYLVLELNTSIPCDTLEYLQVTGSSGEFDGIYQILDMISSNTALINLKYTADFDPMLTGSVTKYYSNYHAKVNIYAGLNSSHTFQALKPYELAATLSLIPDSNNEIKFSISEILKSYIKVNNNLLLASLPNNIESYTNFYIGLIESYDNSDGYTVTTQESSEALDQSTFEGTAANSILEFKNIQSGYLTDYIMNRATAKFLTLFAIPVIFGCSDTGFCYYDISFIKTAKGDLYLRQVYYKDENVQSTVDTSIPKYSDGIYRQQLEGLSCAYDNVLVSVIQIITVPELSTFLNKNSGTAWVIGSNPSVTLINTGQSKEYYSTNYALVAGTYNFDYNFNIDANPLNLVRVEVNFYSNNVSVGGGVVYPPSSGDNVGIMSITLPSAIDEIRFGVINLSGGTRTTTIKSFQNSAPVTIPISETKSISIDCKCANQSINLSWLNNLGGFEYWQFKAFKTYSIAIGDTGETNKNLFPEWPKSYGETASTINKQTFRKSTNQITVNSQHVTLDQLEALQYIKSSILVEIINDRFDKRRVIVDKDSFVTHIDNDKLHTISFNITFTDDIPSQRV